MATFIELIKNHNNPTRWELVIVPPFTDQETEARGEMPVLGMLGISWGPGGSEDTWEGAYQ